MYKRIYNFSPMYNEKAITLCRNNFKASCVYWNTTILEPSNPALNTQILFNSFIVFVEYKLGEFKISYTYSILNLMTFILYLGNVLLSIQTLARLLKKYIFTHGSADHVLRK